MRIISGYLTPAQLEDFITRNRIRVILFANGRFDLLPGFRAWVAQRYTQVATFGQDGALFLPKNTTPQWGGLECRRRTPKRSPEAMASLWLLLWLTKKAFL